MNCRHHPECPGCPLLDAPYADQLAAKEARLAAALGRYPHLGLPRPEPIVPAIHQEAYRHRLKLPIHLGAGGVAVGLYSRDGKRVLDTPDCPVLEPRLRAALGAMRSALAGHPEVHSLDLRVSAATGRVQAVLACRGGDFRGGRRSASALLSAVPGLASLAVSVADPEKRRVMGARPRTIAGADALEEHIGSTRYRLHPGAFFQADPRQAERLHALVRAAVGDAPTVADLYAGVGAYALALAPGRTRVVAVEEVPLAAESARAAAPPDVEVVCDAVEGWLARLGRVRFACAVLNPARRGSSVALLSALPRHADRLVYVSCGPETLGRDLDILACNGLHALRIQPIDLFPQTPEVETVVTLGPGARAASWATPGGRAQSPWGNVASGALGRPERALALVIGDPGASGDLGRARFRRIGIVATHALVRLDLDGPLVPALAALARRGHPTAGEDVRTRRFFAEKAGLLRPFVHVEVAVEGRGASAGDLVQALLQLGASPPLLARAGAHPPTAGRSGPADPSTPSRPGRRGGSRRRS